MEAHVVRRKVFLDARPGEVWNALTNGNLTEKYFSGFRVESDWKTGSDITFSRKSFYIFTKKLEGKILEIIPEKRLKYYLTNPGGGKSVVTEELLDVHGKTVLDIQDDVGVEHGTDERYRRSVLGWNETIDGLKKLFRRN